MLFVTIHFVIFSLQIIITTTGSINLNEADEEEDDGFFFVTDKSSPKRTNKKKASCFASPPFVGGDWFDAEATEVELFQDMTSGSHYPHVLVKWKDSKVYNRCTLYWWCFSGLLPRDVSARIAKGGKSLIVQVPWPAPLQDASELTRDTSSHHDSTKFIELESIFKHLKKGTPGAIVTTEIEFNLGMRVENEFHNETIIVGNEGGRRGNLQEIKGNKMMRYFQDAEMPDGRLVKKQILISKFEMIGVRDNYQRNTAFQCDFDDPEPEEAVEEENYDGFSHVSKKMKSPLSASKPSSLSFDSSGPTIHGGRVPSSPNASAIRSAKVAAAQAEMEAAIARSEVDEALKKNGVIGGRTTATRGKAAGGRGGMSSIARNIMRVAVGGNSTAETGVEETVDMVIDDDL